MAAKSETGTVLQAVRLILSDRFQYAQNGSIDAWPGLRDLLPSTIAWCNFVRTEADDSSAENSLKAVSNNIRLLLTVGEVLQHIHADAKSASYVFEKACHWAKEGDELLIAMCKAKLAYSWSVMYPPQYKKALVLRVDVRKLRTKLPKDHPDVVQSMKDLAWSHSDLGRHKEALTLREEVLKLQQGVLKPNDPEIAFSMATLALSYGRFRQKFEDAQELLEEALEILKQSPLPEDSTKIAGIKGNLANVYSKREFHKKALEIRKELLEYWQKTSEDQNHPFITTAMRNLAVGRYPYKEAIKLQEEVVKRNKNMLPERRKDVTISMNDLARSYFNKAERYEEAIELQEKVVARNEEMLPAGDRLVTISKDTLARYKRKAKGWGGGRGRTYRGKGGKGRGRCWYLNTTAGCTNSKCTYLHPEGYHNARVQANGVKGKGKGKGKNAHPHGGGKGKGRGTYKGKNGATGGYRHGFGRGRDQGSLSASKY
jgi:tetratricopeptide (TPR) repeat protein